MVVRRQLRRRQVVHFLRSCRPAWSGWRRARRRIIGGGRSSGLATGAADATALCEGVCEAPEERCGRCGGDLRGGDPPDDALRRTEDVRAAEHADAAPDSPVVRSQAHHADQCDPRPSGGVRDCGADRAQRCGEAAADIGDGPGRRISDVAAACSGGAGRAAASAGEPAITGARSAGCEVAPAQRGEPHAWRVPGIGPIDCLRIGRERARPRPSCSVGELAALLGLPSQISSSGKERLGRISNRGHRYLRTLLAVGALRCSATPRRTGGHRSCAKRSWNAGRPRWRPSRSPTSPRASPGSS